jgi:hypothetical protein
MEVSIGEGLVEERKGRHAAGSIIRPANGGAGVE